MSRVVRDFIPAGEKNTATKVALEAQKLRARGAGFRDFIPSPDHKLLPPSGSEASHREAIERAMARQASAAREDFNNAVMKLKGQTVSQAIEAIRQAPYAVMEMTLVAEQLNGNRKSILQVFPEVDPEVVLRWKEINAGAPDPATSEQASPTVANEATAGDAEE